MLLLIIFLSNLLLGCNGEKEKIRIKTLVMNELETRYEEEFEIKRMFYDQKRSKWVSEVYPKENNIDDETFFAYVKKDPKERGVENYYFMKVSNLTTIYYKPIIKKKFKGKKIYFSCGIEEHTKKKLDKYKYRTIKNLIEKNGKDVVVHFEIYIFEDVVSTEEKKEEFIKEVWELFKYLKSQNLKWASITINIYDEEFFGNKDVEHILKESNWFSSGTSEFDVFEYRRKKKYVLYIEEKDYKNIENIKDIKKRLRKLDWSLIKK